MFLLVSTSMLLPIQRSSSEKTICNIKQFLQEIATELKEPNLHHSLIAAYIHEAQKIHIYQANPGKQQRKRFYALQRKLNAYDRELQKRTISTQK